MDINFDPGFIPHISAFVPNIEFMHNNLNNFTNFNQKKLQYRMYYPKLQKFLKNYIAFYLGCILWAQYIKQFEGENVLNNLCYGGEYDEKETLQEVDFVENYLEQFKKDVKYYTGKTEEIDSRYPKIINAYKEFLKVNAGFVKLKKTDDIKLPSCIKVVKNLDKVKTKIDSVVQSGELWELLEFTDKVL
ncbi:hypothetical protein II810_02200 [bacterium]|nr:hypothetical protein [bacterium]